MRREEKNKQSDYGLIERLTALRDLLERGSFTRREICKALPQYYSGTSSTQRRLTRDIKALRQFGYSVEWTRPNYAYSIQNISSLYLDDAEVLTLNFIQNAFASNPPLAMDVSTVLQKIFLSLPKRQLSLLSKSPPISISLKPALDYQPHIGTIRVLQRALQSGRKIRFAYPSLNDETTIVHLGVEPYEIQFFDRHYYLIGFSPQATQTMEFRVDRIDKLELMPAKNAFARKRETVPFVYRLSKKIARLGISERFLNQIIELQSDGSAIIQAEGYSEFRIVQDILRYGEQAEILAPKGLREKMKRVVKQMSERYKQQDK